MVKVTYEWLEEHTYRGVGLKKKQGKILGLPYPLEKGWKRKVIGMEISDKDAEKFSELGSHPRKKNAVNRNDDREFLEKHKRLMKEREEKYENRTKLESGREASLERPPLSPSKKPEDLPGLIKLTFDDLAPADLSLLAHRRIITA